MRQEAAYALGNIGFAHTDLVKDAVPRLIEMLEAEFQPQEFHDEFRDHVLEMLAAKVSGQQVQKHVPQAREVEMDLSQALEASIKQVRKRA